MEYYEVKFKVIENEFVLNKASFLGASACYDYINKQIYHVFYFLDFSDFTVVSVADNHLLTMIPLS